MLYSYQNSEPHGRTWSYSEWKGSQKLQQDPHFNPECDIRDKVGVLPFTQSRRWLHTVLFSSVP